MIYTKDGVLTNDPNFTADTASAEARMGQWLSEQRFTPPDQEPQVPGLGGTIAAAARTQNIIGSAVTNRLSRLMAGVRPFQGFGAEEQTGRTGGFSPYTYLADPAFWQRHPYATGAYDSLAGAEDDNEFGVILSLARQQAEDFQTLADSGMGRTLATGLAVNLVDPINLVPASWFYKTARGARTGYLLANAARLAAFAGTANAVQEEALRALSPGRPDDRLTADAFAFTLGAGFGGTIGFLSSPNFKPEARGLRRWVSTNSLDKLERRIQGIFAKEVPDLDGQPRNFVTALEDGRTNLQAILDSGPSNDDGPTGVVALIRTEDAQANIPADDNARLWRQVQDKYGDKVQLIRHPLQDDYDAFTPLERALNDAELTVRRLQGQEIGAKAATSAELAEGVASMVAQEGVTAFGKVLSFFTPGGRFDANMLDAVQTLRRVLFYDGTISKAAAIDPNYSGAVPAEALKDLYATHLYEALAAARDAYAPDRNYGALLGRDESGQVRVQTAQKIAAFAGRQPIDGTFADGSTFSIPGYNHYGDFMRAAVRVMREQKAASDGLTALDRQQVPPQLQNAAAAIQRFYGQLLDVGDYAGLLPGKRALAEAEATAEERAGELGELYDQRDQQAAPPPPPVGTPDLSIPPPGPPVQTILTRVPPEWRGVELYDWGRKGLRTQGNVAIRAAGQRTRKSWDKLWNSELARVTVPNPGLVRALRTLTDEVWPVHVRHGQFWRVEYYFAPKALIETARELAQRKAADVLAGKIEAAEARLAKATERVSHVQDFIDAAPDYFTRRFLTENIRSNRDGFKAWLKRSWERSRNIIDDPETGKKSIIADGERPLIDTIRDKLRIGEEIRTEADLANADAALFARYNQETADYFERSAQATWETLTHPDHAHGVEAAFTGGSPFVKRRLFIDEADPAAAQFLDFDAERILSSYFHTVGGKVAVANAIRRAADKGLFGSAGREFTTGAEALTWLEGKFQALQEATAAVDRTAGTRLTPAVQRSRESAMRRFIRRLGNLEGRGLMDPTHGANALLAWGGNTVLNLNYLALLGGQVLAAINDAATLVLFSEITSIPRNVKMLVKAMLPLKEAPARDLRLMHLAFEAEHARVLSIGDIDHDATGTGVGYGATRAITSAIDVGLSKANRVFNEASLINSWNRYAKRAGAMIVLDRLLTHSKGMLKAQALIDGGMEMKAAIRQAGMAFWAYGRMKELGIDVPMARRILDLVRRYGTDEDGRPLADMDPDALLDSKGLMLPDAGRWLAEEGDSARPAYETLLTAINTETERAMVIQPGLTDKPLLNDQWFGRAINQFQTFGYAWANQVLRPLAQRPAGKQLATFGAYAMTGAFVDAVRNHLSGRRDIDETAALWLENPLGMTYSVVNTSGISGWLNRPMGFLDKAGLGLGTLLGNTQISRAAFQSRSFWGSLSPTADLIDRTVWAVTDSAKRGGPEMKHWHALRKSAPFQNLIWFKMLTRFAGFDPFVTNLRQLDRAMKQEPEP